MVTLKELAQWTSGVWSGDESEAPCGFCHDTRTLTPGDVYIAIRGGNQDGHRFVEAAIEKGAAGVIVDREFPGLGKPQLVVPDTMKALWQIAAGVRSTWTGIVIGVTGSAGKTTVKEMVAAVLSQKGVVSKTKGNWNNDIGLPLSMIAADRKSDFFVLEIGMNHPGEIDPLARLLRPDWAIVTNVGKAHIEFFDGVEKIADEKAAILKHAVCAVLNQNGEWFDRLKLGFCGKLVGLTTESFVTNEPGEHMQLNARFAATIGLGLGLSREEIQAGLYTFAPAPMRWECTVLNDVLFVNDAYNANPLSMRAALSTFSQMACAGRKWVVLGGMRELGESAEAEHRALGEVIDEHAFDEVIAVGAAGAQMGCRGALGIEKSEAVAILRKNLRAGDAVLLKASRGERLETILEEFKKKLI